MVARDFINKPIYIQNFIDKVEKIINKKETIA
jgi:FixJ family two-component response regulator